MKSYILKRSLLVFLITAILYVHTAGSSINQIKDSIVFVFDTVYLESLGKQFELHPYVTEYQNSANMGGNTSVRNVNSVDLKWKTAGYYQRNRDLGQLFIPKKDTWVKSIVLRTGPAESAVLHDTPGSEVFMQFFEIHGQPVINDNGTPKGTSSTHGFNNNHRTDDFIEGIEYKSMPVIYRGVFPEDIPATKDKEGNVLGNDGCLVYFRWTFENAVLFKANHRYGFMVGILEEGLDLGFTLANNNKAAIADVPSLNDRHTPYKGGWAFRREGDGTLPPTMIPGETPPQSDSLIQMLKSESLFGEGNARFNLSPTSDGYPDVDTYRAFEFYVEEEFVLLEKIDFLFDEMTMKVGDRQQLEVQFMPEDATDRSITWFSSNLSVAHVDTSGFITALKPGQAAITAMADGGNINTTCFVSVENTTSSAYIYRKVEDKIAYSPNPVTNGILQISSDNAQIAEVKITDLKGVVVYHKKFNSSSVIADLKQLKTGLYIANIQTSEGHVFQKLVIP